jgi:hypothetical protein
VTEVDPEKQRRQRVVRKVRPELRSGAAPFAAGLDEIPALMKRSLEKFLVAAGEAAAPRSEGTDLAIALRDLACLRSTVESFRLRPEKSVAARFLLGVEEIENAVTAVLDALSADTPIAAQRLERSMQTAIDAASRATTTARDLLRIWRELSKSDTSLISWIASAVDILAPGQVLRHGYLDFEEVGAALLTERLHESCPRGFGISVALLDFMSRLGFDEEGFWGIVREQLELLRANRPALEALASDRYWEADWQRQGAALWEIGERSRVLFMLARTDDQYVWTGLAVAHDIEEGPAKRLLTTLQMVAGVPGTYDEILAKGVGNLAEWAQSKGFRAAANFQSALRNAHAHRDYRIDAGNVILTALRPPPGGPPSYTAPEFGDALLSVLEATMAMWLGTLLATSEIGMTPDASTTTEIVPAEAAVGALLSAGGWRDVKVETRGDVVRVRASATRDPNMSEFAGLLPALSTATMTVVTRLDCPCGVVRLEIPLETLRRFRDAPDDWKQIAAVTLYRGIFVNGEPLIPIDYFRKIVALEALRSGSLPSLPAAMRRLREMRRVCTELGDLELDAGIARLQSIRRTGALGLGEANAELGEVITWAGAQVSAGAWAAILSAGTLS